MAHRLPDSTKQALLRLGEQIQRELDPHDFGFVCVCFKYEGRAGEGNENFTMGNADKPSLIRGLKGWIAEEEGKTH